MKWILILWAVPLTLLGSWYGLSYYDINFGTRILSRDLHDLVFIIYGNLLGLDPDVIPGLVLKAVILDSTVLFGFILLRKHRKAIAAALRSLLPAKWASQPDRESEASLSSAP